MKLKPIHYFLGGVALTALVAAARFAGSTPLDQTFTYQGQLRNAGQLVSGPVDLRITLWDSDTAGSQVGTANSFNAMQLTDGRFACGLNFGNAAFDGSNRWIQVEFRNPAGSGQYLALSPRDKITATPYALYALNGANGVWVYDTNQQSVSVMGKKVGIGTSNPTAALEVVSANGGDDSVKLPVRSIGANELVSDPISANVTTVNLGNGTPVVSRQFTTSSDAAVLVQGTGVAYYWGPGGYGVEATIFIDGQPICPAAGTMFLGATVVAPGIHVIEARGSVPGLPQVSWYCNSSFSVTVVNRTLDLQ